MLSAMLRCQYDEYWRVNLLTNEVLDTIDVLEKPSRLSTWKPPYFKIAALTARAL